jgi:hypothetical protein
LLVADAEQEGIMSRTERWVIVVGLLGATASAAAAGLCWLLLTQPVAFAHYLQRML